MTLSSNSQQSVGLSSARRSCCVKENAANSILKMDQLTQLNGTKSNSYDLQNTEKQ